MADLRKLKPAELCQLINGTPLGPVLEITELSRQRKRAGAKIGDGRTLNFLRYLCWLVLQRHQGAKPAGESARNGKQDRNEYQAALMRKKRASVREIGPIPAVVNPERRAACERDLERFLKTYFAERFPLPFSADHREIISSLQTTVLEGGLFAMAMPRGFGKTTIVEATAIWAAVYGHRRFVVPLGKIIGAGVEMLDSIKSELETNEELAADFPEVCTPIRKLERIGQRAGAQMCQGEHTYLVWKDNEIVLPTIRGSKASGCVIKSLGMNGRIRGLKKPLAGGGNLRPDLVLGDDPQTDQSAANPEQTRKLLKIIRRAVLRLAGPKKKIAIAIPCTCIEPDDLADMLLDRKKSPEWRGKRFCMLYKFPEKMALWEEYRKLRIESLQKFEDIRLATEFYAAHRAEMDAGAEPAWAEYWEPGELSAVQNAMNFFLADEDSFLAEAQNTPRRRQEADVIRELTVEEVAGKLSGIPAGLVPLECTRLTAFIDVQHRILFYAVVAWDEKFGGSVIDYSTYPKQARTFFAAVDASPTLQSLDQAAGLPEDAAIYKGLESLTNLLLTRNWQRHTAGDSLRVGLCIVDANEGKLRDMIYKFCRQSPFAASLLPWHGMGIGHARKPLELYRDEPGVRKGMGWRIPLQPTQRHLLADVNLWKSFVAARLQTPAGSPGCLTIFGTRAADHEMLARHCCSESRTASVNEGTGRRIEEWRLRPGERENHWWDCLVGSAVAASVAGVQWNVSGVQPPEKPAKKKSLSEIAAEKRAEFEARRRFGVS